MEVGVSRSTWNKWECDRESPPEGLRPAKVANITPGERCTIMRMRANKRQVDVANDLKICEFTVRRMEKDQTDASILLDYWEA